jgi:hypothetical protein
MPAYSVVGNSFTANMIAWAVTSVLILCWTVLFAQRTQGQELLHLSALATVALLPVYHRFVDAVVLLLPLCWCLTVRKPKYKQIALIVVLFELPFLVPGASLLVTLADSGHISREVASSWWWNAVVVPHEVWSVIAISFALLYAMGVSAQIRSAPETIAAEGLRSSAPLAQLPQTQSASLRPGTGLSA